MERQRDDSSGRRWPRLDGVDLLRGLAILFVLLNHVNMRLVIGHIPYGAWLPRFLLSTLVWNGQHGVQMFFAISGFLITSTSIRRWGELSSVRVLDFYRIRFARIAPLLLLLLLILSVLDVAQVHNYIIPSKTGGLGAALLAALTFRISVLEARHGYLPGCWDVLWSLSVEETFYFFFPLVSKALGGRKRLFVTVPALGHTGLDMSLIAIGTCLTIAASEQSGWRSPAVLRPLVGLGQRSYETYLTHMFVVFACFELFLSLGKPPYAVPLLFGAAILVAGTLGALTARFYSEPLNRLLRSRWQTARRSLAAALPVESVTEG